MTMTSDVIRASFITIVALACALRIRAVDSTSEKRLITMLVENYQQNGVDGRPVVNTSTALTVTISFSLIQILHFDTTQQVITLVGWISLRWRDVLLRWNSYEFDNIRQVVLHSDQIWTPDIVLFNAISPPKLIHSTRLIVAQNGDVLWTSHVRYQLTCVTWPRRDDAECQLRFGSWTLSADLLRLQTVDQSAGSAPVPVFPGPAANMAASDFYVRSRDWELTSTTVAAHEVEYPCCPGKNYGDVTYSFRMRRRSSGPREVRSRNLQPLDEPLPPFNAEGSSSTAVRCGYTRTTYNCALCVEIFLIAVACAVLV